MPSAPGIPFPVLLAPLFLLSQLSQLPLAGAASPSGPRQGLPKAPPKAPRYATPKLETTPAPTREWYGTSILATDAGALAFIGLAGAAIPMRSMELFISSAAIASAIAVFNGPIVHALNGNWGRAFASLGVRAASTAGFGFVGFLGGLMATFQQNGDGSTVAAGALIGAAIGHAAASILDTTVFAWNRESEPKPMHDNLTVTPALSFTHGQDRTPTFGLAGRF